MWYSRKVYLGVAMLAQCLSNNREPGSFCLVSIRLVVIEFYILDSNKGRRIQIVTDAPWRKGIEIRWSGR